MKTNWFKKAGWIYLPISIIGGILTFLTIAFCVNVFMVIDRNSHSVSDTLYNIFPFFVCAFVILFWIASNTSKN